ncbi:nucleotidyltransferase family protein [Dasania sp. GY-MA-18]|uniref:Nucleotidyltransferase family protein n=1 Tax=Dasania phycosphaerae TaxID=2950436 RepID=A0A9J6RP70_9GAMM|nr:MULTISPECIES: nucleotidyltransferase family protein [Dasania]MCR8923913.1 nucleotidyltransferase family protein [Dasania sp. GY-MA-18]MCZ0866347.1 nucleotidyltransferase family protein [Dasania phycosphaerae]MCZ0870071.1 nucleotidyltransferase family protein [Dasania phycosphaerae]
MATNIAAIILAAGQSTRMGAQNKLLLPLDHAPLIMRVVNAAAQAQLQTIIVVTGHEADAVAQATQGLAVRCVHNPDFASGMASSLRCGLQTLVGNNHAFDGAIILLGDMPLISGTDITKLLTAFNSHDQIVAPYYQGRRGNPVLWGRDYFAEIEQLSGDSGAKVLLSRHAHNIIKVPVDHSGIFADIDSPEAYAELTL